MKKLSTFLIFLICFSNAVYAQKGKGPHAAPAGRRLSMQMHGGGLQQGAASVRTGVRPSMQMRGGGGPQMMRGPSQPISQPARPMAAMQQRTAAPQRALQRFFSRPEPSRPLISAERISERRLRSEPSPITERIGRPELSIRLRGERGLGLAERRRTGRPRTDFDMGKAEPVRSALIPERVGERTPETARPEVKPLKQRIELARQRREKQRARVESGQELTQAQERGLRRSPEVKNINQFAQREIAQNPKLKNEVRQAKNRWRTNSTVRNRWYNDWKNYSYYHHHGHFNFDTFLNFAFFAPWYLFPFSFYSTFYDHYPAYWVPYGWFSYPIYWDYGYAQEINLISYVERKDFNDAIDSLERRLDILENELLEKVDAGELDSQSSIELRAKISEIVWLLNDLEQIIYDAQLSYSQEDYLIRRIKNIKQRGNELMNYFEEYRD